MAYKRNYRRSRSGNNLGSAVGDMGAIANKFGPKGALLVGAIGFVVLYFLIPAALEAWLEYNKAKMTGPTDSVAGQVLDLWQLTVLRAGEDHARSSGVAVERLRLLSLFRVCVLSATALAFVGTIAFVGLVGPHIARILLGEDHRFYLPASALCGAVMLAGASILSKTLVAGVVLPIGIVTALVGVPVFLVLVLRSRGGLQV